MALATLAQIRSGLNTRLATISGLQTYAYQPADPPYPCAYVASVGETTYHGSQQSGYMMWPVRVHVLVSQAPPAPESQADLDEFISPTGTNSIKAAIEGSGASQTLSGIVADCVVMATLGEQVFVSETGAFWGAEFLVHVHAGA